MVPFLCFRQYIRKRRQNNEVFPILVSTWLSIRSYLYFWSHILSSKPFILGRFELVGCDALKQYVSASDGCLSAFAHQPLLHLSHFPVPKYLSGWSLTSLDAVLFLMGNRSVPHFLHCHYIFSPLGPPLLTLAPGLGIPGFDGGSIFYLTAGIVTFTTFSSNW